jgi:hypothetical protein
MDSDVSLLLCDTGGTDMRLKSALFYKALGVTSGFVTPANATVWDFAQDLTSSPAPHTGQGPNNAWRYFFAAPTDHDGAYTELDQGTVLNTGIGYRRSTDGFSLVIGTRTNSAPGEESDGLLHPGSGAESDVIVGWQAPSAGTYNVQGLFQDADGSDFNGPITSRGVRAAISSTTTPGVADSDQEIGQFAAALLDASNDNSDIRAALNLGPDDILPFVAEFDFNIDVVAGQWLYFRVNNLGSNLFDSTTVVVRIDDNINVNSNSVPAPGTLGLLAAGLAGLGALRRRRRA